MIFIWTEKIRIRAICRARTREKTKIGIRAEQRAILRAYAQCNSIFFLSTIGKQRKGHITGKQRKGHITSHLTGFCPHAFRCSRHPFYSILKVSIK